MFSGRAAWVLALLVVAAVSLGLGYAWGRSASPAPLERAVVARVVDGDTIVLANGERVRYLSVDTPETVHPTKPVQCYGPEASSRNKELVGGKTVELLADKQDRDRYGRLLRYVFVDGTFVNADLVWEGYARAYVWRGDERFAQTMVQLERAARDARRGLWGACGQH